MISWSSETRMRRALFSTDLNEVVQKMSDYCNEDGVLA